MELVALKSKMAKHGNSVFLKIKGTKDEFICKVYDVNNVDEIADAIIVALRTLPFEPTPKCTNCKRKTTNYVEGRGFLCKLCVSLGAKNENSV